MKTRTRSLSVLAAVLVLSACSTEDTPTAPQASGGAPAGSAAPDAPPATPSDPDATGSVDTGAVLEIDDQVSEGPTVQVKAAAVAKGGWIVVASEDGKNVLGAGMVPAGTTPTAVQVSLADVITEQTELTAKLYDDANADGLYGAGDKPVGNDDQDDDDDPAVFAGELEVFQFTGADVINN